MGRGALAGAAGIVGSTRTITVTGSDEREESRKSTYWQIVMKKNMTFNLRNIVVCDRIRGLMKTLNIFSANQLCVKYSPIPLVFLTCSVGQVVSSGRR